MGDFVGDILVKLLQAASEMSVAQVFLGKILVHRPPTTKSTKILVVNYPLHGIHLGVEGYTSNGIECPKCSLTLVTTLSTNANQFALNFILEPFLRNGVNLCPLLSMHMHAPSLC